MKALIQGTRICQLVDDDKTFDVHSDLQWIDVADNTVVDVDTYVDGKVVKYVEPTKTYAQKRKMAYGMVGEQLDMIYWDQVNNTTTFKDHIAKVKSDNPKGG
tara:strand:+ start:714 stop:1019 length:306 start_codon:yes stop_codon:yes gene_type:complete